MIAIVIVTWNGWRDAIQCIRSCLAQSEADIRIILCDNASPDATADLVEQWATGALEVPPDPAAPIPLTATRPATTARISRTATGRNTPDPQLLIVDTGANLGFAGGCNVGLRHALAQGASHVLLLNPDTVIPPETLSLLLADAARDPARGLTGATMRLYHDPSRLQGTAGALNLRTFASRHLGHAATTPMPPHPRRHELLYPIGAAMLASRAFLTEIGLMEESYFLYYEEADWALRARGRYTIAIALDATVYHKVGATAGSTPELASPTATARLTRSRLACARRHAPARLPRVYAAILADLARATLSRRWGKARGLLQGLTLSSTTRTPAAPPPPAPPTPPAHSRDYRSPAPQPRH